jgi:hypothetical protein
LDCIAADASGTSLDEDRGFPGDYVTLRVVDFLRENELRFTELQRSIGDVNSVTLSNRLKRWKRRAS